MGNAFGKKKPNRKCLMFGLRESGKTTILYKLKLWEAIPTTSTIGFNHEFIGYKRCNLDIYDIGWIFHEHNLYDPNNLNHIDITKIKINEFDFPRSYTPRKILSRKGKESDLDGLKQNYLKYDTIKLCENVNVIIIVIDCNNRYAMNHSDHVDGECPTKPSLRQTKIVVGYFRDNEKNYNLNIPDGIIDICMGYYVSNQSVKDLLHFVLTKPEWKEVPILIWANKQDKENAMSINEVCKELNLGSTAENNPDVMKDKGDNNWYIQAVCGITGDGLYEGLDWIHQKMNKK